jgi:hypothetical protein
MPKCSIELYDWTIKFNRQSEEEKKVYLEELEDEFGPIRRKRAGEKLKESIDNKFYSKH